MVQAAVSSANALRTAAANAGTLEQQNQQKAAQGQPKQSALDVWTHTGDALRDRMDRGSMYDRASPEMKEALTDVGNWHRAKTDDVANAMGQQWDKVSDDFMNMIGMGDPKKNPEGVLQNVGAFFGLLTGVEQLLTTFVGLIPFPAMPALRVLDLAAGLPHGHAHPPTFGTPLPSIGPILPIPYVSGAATVLINGMPAARCGDMGIGAWCGGYVPIFEVFLGSCNVWVEGARAGRLLCDITNHCIFSKRPGPKDPPVGPFIGMTIIASGNVAIGGFPLPSLVSMAMGAAFQAMFKGLGKVFGAVRKRMGRAASHMDECIDGAPIMPVTGDMVDEFVDFELHTAVPFVWRRYYYSSWNHVDGPHGYGYRHEYQRELRFTGRAWIYVDPENQKVEFPQREPGPDGFGEPSYADPVASDGMLLRRGADGVLEIYEPGQPTMVFRMQPGKQVALLDCLRHGGDAVQFRYDDHDRLTAVDVCGELIRMDYDEHGHIIEMRRDDDSDPKRISSYQYGDSGCLTRWTDAVGHHEQYEYDGLRRMTVYTTRRKYRFLHEYDPQGRCVREWGEDGLYDVRMEYYPEESKTVARYADGATKVYRYNVNRTITERTDAEGGIIQWVLDDQGKVVQEIDGGGNVTQWLYNDLGGNIGRRDALGHVHPPVNVQPNPPNPLTRTLPDTALQWEFGKLLSVQTAELPAPDDPFLRAFPQSIANEFSSVLEPDSPARTTDRTAANGNGRRHDPLGRLIELEDGDGSRQSWSYDADGNVVEHRDRDGSVYRQVFASWRSLNQRIDPLGGITSFEYSLREYPTTIKDPGGTESQFIYDLKDRIVEVRRHNRVKERYYYDDADNMIAKLDGLGQSLVTWEVGPAKLDKARRLASGEEHTFTYDDDGRILSAATSSAVVECTHDHAGRRTSDLRDGLGVTHKFAGDRLVTTTCFEKFIVTYRRHQNGDLTVIDPTGGMHRISMRSSGLISRSLANGSRELCAYNATGRCLKKYLIAASAETWGRTFHYSAEGDLLRVDDSHSGTTRYLYDAAHRLSREVLPDGTERTFARDLANNLIGQPGLDQVRLEPGNRLVEANGDSFSYNDRNHIAQRRSQLRSVHYEYDSLDRLVQCVVGETNWTAQYDALSRRISKTWNDQTTEYYWDDLRLAAEIRQGRSLRIYLYADHVALVPFMFVDYPDLDADPKQGTPYYLFHNQIGTPVRVEDQTGEVVWSSSIDPYGCAQIERSGSVELCLRFPGHYHDPETNLHCNGHRYYSPELGRYLQSDPIGIAGGLNLYAYCSSPLTQVDLDGLATHPGGRQTPDPKGEAPTPTPAPKPLKFGADDLVYGPSARGKLRALQESAGGKLLTDMPKPPDKSWGKFSLETMDANAKAGNKLHFDLTHMEDLPGVLGDSGKHADKVTAMELRHLRDGWGKQFNGDNTKFYRDGVEVPPPW